MKNLNSFDKDEVNLQFVHYRMIRMALSNAKYSYSKAGFLTALYYFITRYFMPLGIIKNYKEQKSTSLKSLNELNNDGYTKLQDYPIEDTNKLTDYFMEKVSIQDKKSYQSLKDYFNFWKKKGNIRPTGIYCDGSKNPISDIAKSEEIIEIVSTYLGLKKENIYYYAGIDALISVGDDQIIYDNYDGAVFFHRDADALKFVKFFIYLTDCFEGDGHHEYILGSHNKFPKELFELKRYDNKYILRYLLDCKFVKITGNKGTAFLENTLGMHRGTKPYKNDRLAMIVCYLDKTTSKMHSNAHSVI